MVKTRNQTKEYQQSRQSKKSNDEGHMTTRSGLKIKKLERVELPGVKLSKEMKRRANVKKEIAKRSWKRQTDKKCNRFERLERDFLKQAEVVNIAKCHLEILPYRRHFTSIMVNVFQEVAFYSFKSLTLLVRLFLP